MMKYVETNADRGYVYDPETELYYLQSRYYNPEMGRFINADTYASTGQGLLGNNKFAYCGNNSVSNTDATGMLHERTAGGEAACPIPYTSIAGAASTNILRTSDGYWGMRSTTGYAWPAGKKTGFDVHAGYSHSFELAPKVNILDTLDYFI